MEYDKNFEKILELLFGIEGGYSDNPNDKGGKTNLGVTQDTFNAWRKKNNLEKNANKMISDGFYRPSYYDELTPFDKGYNGNLNPVEEIPNRDAKGNKSSETKLKNGYNLAQNNEPYFKRSLEDLAPWEIDKFLKRLI